MRQDLQDCSDLVLETPRLALRKFREGDLADLARLYADEEVRRYFPGGTMDGDQTKEELGWYLEGGFREHPGLGLWATIDRSTGRFIGRCGLIPWTIEGKEEVEIAYLLDREFWGRGLGTEAADALRRYGFERLGLPRMISLIHPGNVASIRTAEKAGLTYERDVVLEGEEARLYSVRSPGRA